MLGNRGRTSELKNLFPLVFTTGSWEYGGYLAKISKDMYFDTSFPFNEKLPLL